MQHLDTQLHGLDDIVSRVQEHNNSHHESHLSSLDKLATNVQASYDNIGEQFTTSYSRVEELDSDMSDHASALRTTLPSLSANSEIRRPLAELREEVVSQTLEEYKATGETPQRIQYSYPHALPRTEQHETLLAKLHGSPLQSPSKLLRSPNKTPIFNDSPLEDLPLIRPGTATSTPSLREVDINITIPGPPSTDVLGDLMPPMKRQNTGDSKLPQKKRGARMTVAGGVANPRLALADRENATVDLSRSVGPGTTPGNGRRLGLRSHNSG